MLSDCLNEIKKNIFFNKMARQCELCTRKDVPVDVYPRMPEPGVDLWRYEDDDALIILCPSCLKDYLNYLQEDID